MSGCVIANCTRQGQLRRGLCVSHYQRARTSGMLARFPLMRKGRPPGPQHDKGAVYRAGWAAGYKAGLRKAGRDE